MNEFILAALVFGLTAGFQPGPLSIIVIHQTLTYGLKSGIKACLAPIITDGPINTSRTFYAHSIQRVCIIHQHIKFGR
jgi:threonine/homoserine/homoserine lactone efflux protein